MKKDDLAPPDILYKTLFETVQRSGIFPDSKTFVDLIPTEEPATILALFRQEKDKPNFDLKQFLQQYFYKPEAKLKTYHTNLNHTIREHISALWSVLRRSEDMPQDGSSLLPLPYPYIVPGGRFREVYYWDSYFTMLGLQVDQQYDLIRSMVDNFAYLIQTFGYIPNANRTYYLSRSQPPFFSLMVKLLAEIDGESCLVKYKEALIIEHQFWTSPERSVQVGNFTLQRYWDQKNIPRQEAFAEDIELPKHHPELYRDIRAAAESGWDFSSRWQIDPSDLATTRTTDMIPVDLNCLLYHLEKVIGEAASLASEKEQANVYQKLAETRATAIQQILFDQKKGVYVDYIISNQTTSDSLTLAMLYPLFFGLTTPEIADNIAKIIQEKFLHPGGLVATLENSGQQWDAPNGWPPLQWIAVKGLLDYGYKSLSLEITIRYTQLIETVFRNTGKLMEKYNVEDLTLIAGGGEYPVQDGFGWTNGVYLKMKNLYAGL